MLAVKRAICTHVAATVGLVLYAMVCACSSESAFPWHCSYSCPNWSSSSGEHLEFELESWGGDCAQQRDASNNDESRMRSIFCVFSLFGWIDNNLWQCWFLGYGFILLSVEGREEILSALMPDVLYGTPRWIALFAGANIFFASHSFPFQRRNILQYEGWVGSTVQPCIHTNMHVLCAVLRRHKTRFSEEDANGSPLLIL